MGIIWGSFIRTEQHNYYRLATFFPTATTSETTAAASRFPYCTTGSSSHQLFTHRSAAIVTPMKFSTTTKTWRLLQQIKNRSKTPPTASSSSPSTSLSSSSSSSSSPEGIECYSNNWHSNDSNSNDWNSIDWYSND